MHQSRSLRTSKSTTTKATTMSQKYIPEEILVQILVRLPTVCLVRCTCVCREWYSLITSPDFISTHLSFSSKSQLLILRRDSDTYGKKLLYLHCNPERLNNYRIIHHPVNSRPYMVGSIHGLICLADSLNRNDIYVWNPSIKRCITVPAATFSFTADLNSWMNDFCMYEFGFGYDHKRSDYKVVTILCFNDEHDYNPEVFVYALKERKWRPISAEGMKFQLAWGNCFFNGAVNWVAHEGMNRCFILSFDMINDRFKRMELPEEIFNRRRYVMGISEIKGSLAIFQSSCFQGNAVSGCCNIWVMKEYGVAASWIKMGSVTVEGQLRQVFGFWGNGEEILLEEWKDSEYLGLGFIKELVLYDLKSRAVKSFGVHDASSTYDAKLYTESLLLLDRESGSVSYEEFDMNNQGKT